MIHRGLFVLRVKSMLSLRNGNSLAVSIFQVPPQALHLFITRGWWLPANVGTRIDIYCRVYANIVCHRELRGRISHRRDTTIDGFIIQVMRHCPMARQSSRRHNATVLRCNEENVGAAHHIRGVPEIFTTSLMNLKTVISHRQPCRSIRFSVVIF